jgi:peptidoglycan/LPS O-acetylase OafA/YrhL
MTVASRGVTLRGGSRLGFLDALRGIAVGLVLVQHVGEQLVPAVRELSTSAVQLGQMGVIVFFLCSGFIVPASLERGDPAASRGARVRSFWRGRFFRLYPMYWLSLAGALLLDVLGRYSPPPGVDGPAWAVNAGMVQGLVGVPDAVSVYWSLAFELIFYLAVSLLFLAGLHRRSVLLALGASACCLLAALAGPVLGHPAPLGVFCVATMFTGTVAHRWHGGEVRLRTLAGCLAAALAAGTALLSGTLLGHDDPALLGTRSFAPMLGAWIGAYAVFCAGLALRHRRTPRWLVRLGAVSYAVYLLHPLVLAAVPPVGGAVGTAVVWIGLTVVLSEACHRLVERPAIRLGRRLARRSPAGSAPLVPVAPVPVVPTPLVAAEPG